MYVDPEVLRRAASGGEDDLAPLRPLLAEGSAVTGAQGLADLVGWPEEGEGEGTRGRAPALVLARLAARALRVLPLTSYEVFLAADLARTYPGLPPRTALHVATMLNNGVLEVVSDDPTFDRVSEVRRIPPARLANVLARRAGARGAADRAGGEVGEPGSPPEVGGRALPAEDGEGGHHP